MNVNIIRPQQGDLKAMIKGLINSIHQSNIKNSPDVTQRELKLEINNIRQLTPESDEMASSVVKLWINSVHSILDYIDDFYKKNDEEYEENYKIKIRIATDIIAYGHHLAIKYFELYEDISIKIESNAMEKYQSNNLIIESPVLLSQDFFILMYASKVKLGELKHGVNALIKSKSSISSNF